MSDSAARLGITQTWAVITGSITTILGILLLNQDFSKWGKTTAVFVYCAYVAWLTFYAIDGSSRIRSWRGVRASHRHWRDRAAHYHDAMTQLDGKFREMALSGENSFYSIAYSYFERSRFVPSTKSHSLDAVSPDFIDMSNLFALQLQSIQTQNSFLLKSRMDTGMEVRILLTGLLDLFNYYGRWSSKTVKAIRAHPSEEPGKSKVQQRAGTYKTRFSEVVSSLDSLIKDYNEDARKTGIQRIDTKLEFREPEDWFGPP